MLIDQLGTTITMKPLKLIYLASMLVLADGAFAAESRTDAWVGTWSAAAQPAMPAALMTLEDQTVRLIAHSSIDGRSVRVRLSNTYGHEPLTLGAVRIARRDTGADTLPDTTRIVKFRGQTAVTIWPGETLT